MGLYDEAREFERIEEEEVEKDFTSAADQEEYSAGYRFQVPNLDFLKAPTGEGPIEEYINHPLNFDKKNSTARILRGLTGICGSLDYGFIDVIIGTLEKIKEKKTNVDRP